MFQISLRFGMKIDISVSEYPKGPKLHCSLSSNAKKDLGPVYLSFSHLINIKRS